MAYGLPVRGQRDWDDEINNSIAAVKTAADDAATAAGNANTNLALLPSQVGDTGTDIGAALAAEYAGIPANLGRAVGQGEHSFDPRHYSAVPVGVTGSAAADDTAAVQAAINAAIASTAFANRHPHVHIPAGEWDITVDGLFSSVGATYQQGLLVTGAGKESTRLNLITGGSEKWFYNNGASDVLNMLEFRDIAFYSDSKDYGNGFQMVGNTGHEQGFTFISCRFKGPWNTIAKVSGTMGTDTWHFIDCDFTTVYGAVLVQDNDQGVLIDFHSCNFTLIYGDFCQVEDGGGGDVKIFGGSMIFDQASGDTTQHWMWNVVESNKTTVAGSGRFTAYGLRFEWRDAYHGFVNAPAATALGSADFVYNDCLASIASGGGTTPREMVDIGVKRKVQFNRCSMPTEAQYTINAAASYAPTSLDTEIVWESCVVPELLSDAVTFTTNYGRASARNCRVSNAPAANRQAVDFDMGWRYAPTGSGNVPVKRAVIVRPDQGMPTNGGTERTILLPKDAKIIGIYVHRPATGASVTAYQIHAGNDTKGVTHASSTAAQFKDTHRINAGMHSATPLYYDCGSTTANRTLRLWSTGGDATLIAPLYAWVEYL